ncbi:MAG: hypothetical protein AAE977_00855 [Thermoplasmataceae archaeon]|jgi:hypothetical protein
MWSSEILDQCAVIMLEDRFPKLIRIRDKEIFLDNTFFFTNIEEGKMYTYRNLGINLMEIDMANLAETPEFDRGSMSVIGNSILRVEVDNYFMGTLDRINKIAGCRMNPNILSHSRDAYVQIEFSENSRQKVSKLLLEAIPKMPMKGELIYMGRHPENMPYIVKLFTETGGSISDLFLVSTEWHMRKENMEKENSGVFMNTGRFIPKYFTSGINDTLIFLAESAGMKGESETNVEVRSSRLFELETKTHYFTDFNREVLAPYYGSLFYEAEVHGNVLTSYYVIDRKLSSLFLTGLERHWALPERKDHYNVVTAAMSLGAIYK